MDKSYLYSKIRLNEGAYFFKQGTTKIKKILSANSLRMSLMSARP